VLVFFRCPVRRSEVIRMLWLRQYTVGMSVVHAKTGNIEH
jgi:hypothetical protein